jgi:hypothetical protein
MTRTRLVDSALNAPRHLLARLTWNREPDYNPPCLWSKGVSRYCDFRGPDWYWLAATESCQSESFFSRYYAEAGGVVWVRLSTQSRDGKPCDLDNFVRGALPSIRKPFSLITTDGDSAFSDIPAATIDALLGCPWLVSWHTQNYDGREHDKLAPFPMGIDLHTPRLCSSPSKLFSLLRDIRQNRPPLDRASLKVFCDLELSLSSGERHRAVAALRKCGHVDFPAKRIPQADAWRRYAEYPFVLSAEGNGLDCHRTWELLYLGAIVITKKSPLDILYEGLPVVTIGDWSEVRDRNLLSRWLIQYGGLTARENVWSRLDPQRLVGSVRERLVRQ